MEIFIRFFGVVHSQIEDLIKDQIDFPRLIDNLVADLTHGLRPRVDQIIEVIDSHQYNYDLIMLIDQPRFDHRDHKHGWVTVSLLG